MKIEKKIILSDDDIDNIIHTRSILMRIFDNDSDSCVSLDDLMRIARCEPDLYDNVKLLCSNDLAGAMDELLKYKDDPHEDFLISLGVIANEYCVSPSALLIEWESEHMT